MTNRQEILSQEYSIMVLIIRLLTGLSVLLFGTLLFFSANSPELVERSAQGFLETQVQAQIEERFPEFAPSMTSQGLQKLSAQLASSQAKLSKRIENGLSELIAATAAKICSCGKGIGAEKQAKLTEIAGIVLDGYLTRIGIARGQLTEIIKGNYNAILTALRSDVMIFLATNLVAFIAILITTFLPNRNNPLLILPAVILLVAVSLSTFSYLFQTNWFFTVLFQDYWGYGYTVMVAGVFGLLLDVVMNKARITNAIFSIIPNALVPVC